MNELNPLQLSNNEIQNAHINSDQQVNQCTFFATHQYFSKQSFIEISFEENWTELVLFNWIGSAVKGIILLHWVEALLMTQASPRKTQARTQRAPDVSCDLQQICRMEDQCCFFADLLITQERNMESEPEQSTSQGSWTGQSFNPWTSIPRSSDHPVSWITTKVIRVVAQDGGEQQAFFLLLTGCGQFYFSAAKLHGSIRSSGVC